MSPALDDLVVRDLAARISDACRSSRALVAIDGPGGAGKSTLAHTLAASLGDATVVPTDDFAAWDDPLDWWPRMMREVVEPIATGRNARYRRRDFLTGELLDWVTVPAVRVTILEGVSSSRREWSDRLCFTVWVETPPEERLRRGLERDGTDARAIWDRWMAAEDAFFAVDRPWERADMIVSGAAHV